jgi:transglutaminase-like putative cysteine protease
MQLRASHTTTYLYQEPVSICHTEVRLAPREERSKHVLEYSLSIHPAPDRRFGHRDYFGNEVTYFSIHEPHQTLTISGESLVEIEPAAPLEPAFTPAWEEAKGTQWGYDGGHALKAYQFVFESPRITPGPGFAEYAKPSFPPERPLLEAALDLCHRIYTGFHYDQQATTVATSVTEVLASRRGVCQDFATCDRLSAIARPRRPLRKRLSEDRRFDRQPGFSRLGLRLLPRLRLARSRPH